MKIGSFEDIERIKERGLKKLKPEDRIRVSVGMATCGISVGGDAVFDAFRGMLGYRDDVILTKTGCIGFCHEEPLVNIYIPEKGILILHRVQPESVKDIVNNLDSVETLDSVLCQIDSWDHLVGGKIEYGNGFEGIPRWNELDFFKPQRKLVMRNAGIINPEDIDEYIAVGGYSALYRVLKGMTPDEVIDEVKKSGLRGRGGAGFPTGVKWELAKNEQSDVKYVICNADEGDPGAYMNRNEMESDPHSVIEGMIIGGYAIGAYKGIIYIRAEYPLALYRLQKAIDEARSYGLLGKNILGSGFDFDITISKGAGAFVCGEETALIASIEGETGRPRPRPPYPAQKGLWGKPTNINNVETWTNIPLIIKKGGEWFRQFGNEKSPGTKVFSLVGKVENVGLVEVELGTPIKTVVYDIGGGAPKGRKVKAVQTGGPSGGCIPAKFFDLPIDYENLTKVGSIMGSGGMVVMDENTCMVDTARFFLDFSVDESCGKCVPCREGLKQMLTMLQGISSGEGARSDLETLNELSETIKTTSLCGLGQTAPNPVLTTLKYFKEEYIEHVDKKRCRAGICEDLVYAPCHNSCPLGQDAPSYIAYIAHGEFDRSLEVIMRTNPFPGILGRVCDHPCELHCRAGEGGDPISIRALKRFAADRGEMPHIKIETEKDKRVAIVGSGPAGLSAAYFLRLKGYGVDIFESEDKPGGMLRIIPDYRLPKDVLDREIKRIEGFGVNIKHGIKVGEDKTINELFNEGYDALFLGVGFRNGAKLNIPGAEAEGVFDGISFLKRVAKGEKLDLGESIYVVGGGNVAMDAARTAWRIAENANVNIVYRRTRREMPAIGEEIEDALFEGINIEFLTNPVRIITENGRVKAVEWVKMKLAEIDESGRARPIPIEGSEFVTPVDTLIVCVGQTPDLSFAKDVEGLSLAGNTVSVDLDTMATSLKGVFAGGDIVTGPSTVVRAAAAGKTASESIDRYLKGGELKREFKVVFPSENVPLLKFSAEELKKLSLMGRVESPKVPLDRRRGSFAEVEKTLDVEAAIVEAKRCLRCDVKER